MSRVAVVLMAYGSPERLGDVPDYYADIRGGRPVRPELVDDLVERYRRLGIGGRSPLDEATEAQRAALQRELGIPVCVGMKHWRPRIADAVEAALGAGAETIVGLVLAPQYSRLSIGEYRERLEKTVDGRAELAFVESWHDHGPFLDALAARVRGSGAHVVFTAHSLPARILDEGDPYESQLQESAAAIAERAALRECSTCYQSESATGEPWLGPDILDHLEDLRRQGVRRVLACPHGFVADHLEIFWDLDTEAAMRAAELGIDFARTDMPNADPLFVHVLASLVRARLGSLVR
jgi:ferrochelatase